MWSDSNICDRKRETHSYAQNTLFSHEANMSEPCLSPHHKLVKYFPFFKYGNNSETKLDISNLWRSPSRCGRAPACKCVIIATVSSYFIVIIVALLLHKERFPALIEEPRG